MAYTYADTFIERQVDRYLNLSSAQEKQVEKSVDGYLAWHRKQMLPQYASYLRGLARACQEVPLSRERFERGWKDGWVIYEATLEGAIPHITPVLITQTKAQVAYFHNELQRRGEEMRKELQKPKEELLEQRASSFVKGVELFTGPLNRDQLDIVGKHAERLFGDPWAWFHNRERRNNALIGFLNNGPSKDDLNSFLRSWLLEPHYFAEPAFNQFRTQWQDQFKDALFEVLSSLTPKQRATMVQNLTAYADDFTDLSS